MGLILILGSSHSFALEVPARPSGRVTDLTDTLSPDEIVILDRKLAHFERETTNQIAVLLISSLPGDSLEDYSIRLAEKWKVGQKGRNNGVLIYLAIAHKKFAILGDEGIHRAVPENYWDDVKDKMQRSFREGRFFEGVCLGIREVGEKLKLHFPVEKDDRNELPDNISEGK